MISISPPCSNYLRTAGKYGDIQRTLFGGREGRALFACGNEETSLFRRSSNSEYRILTTIGPPYSLLALASSFMKHDYRYGDLLCFALLCCDLLCFARRDKHAGRLADLQTARPVGGKR